MFGSLFFIARAEVAPQTGRMSTEPKDMSAQPPGTSTQPTFEEPLQTRKRGRFWKWVIGLVVLGVLYVLSSGPLVVMATKGYFGKSNSFTGRMFITAYRPLRFAYRHTPLRMPLGMYWHVWLPKSFDSDGEPIMTRAPEPSPK